MASFGMAATLSAGSVNPQRTALARGLSSLLVGAPPTDGSAGSEAAAPDREPLRRRNSAQVDRTRVEENRRIIAQQLLEEMLPLLGCTVILIPGCLMLMIVISFMAIYIEGWLVISNYSRAPCDFPLKWWLLAMLLLPNLQICLNSRPGVDQKWKRLLASLLICWTLAGVYMLVESKTCKVTNPELYQYAKLQVMLQAVILMAFLCMHFFMNCGLVTLVFWLHRHGMLDTGPGPSHAARQGLINELESVSYSPDLFPEHDKSDGGPECCICQDVFVEGTDIKKTSCGHYFHEKCLGNWLENGRTCPLCRADLEEAMDPESAVGSVA